VTYTYLSVVSIVVLFPLFWVLKTSFLPPIGGPESYLFRGLFSSESFSLRSYVEVYFESQYPSYLLNSVLITSMTVLISVVLGSLAGYALARFKIKGGESFFFFALTTRMGPPVAFAIPFYLMFNQAQLIDTHLGMITLYVFSNLAFSIWIMRGFFQDIPVDLEEAAMVDGASRLQAFWKIVLPVATAGIVATAIIVFIFAWNEFFYASIFTRTFAKTFPVQLPAYFTSRDIKWGCVAAASTGALIPPLILALFARRRIIRGMTFGVVKG